MDPVTAFWIAQSISVLTGVIAIVMMQFKNMKLVLTFQIIVNLLASANYLLLDGGAGGIRQLSWRYILGSNVFLQQKAGKAAFDSSAWLYGGIRGIVGLQHRNNQKPHGNFACLGGCLLYNEPYAGKTFLFPHMGRAQPVILASL